MFVLALVLFAAAIAAALVGGFGLAGKLPENRFVGVRTEQTMSDPLLWRVANRVAGPTMLASSAIFAGGALVALALPSPWSWVAGAAAVVAAILLAGFGALQGARAASIQARLQMPDATCCSADAPVPSGSSADPATDCGVGGGCGACALKGMCDHQPHPA